MPVVLVAAGRGIVLGAVPALAAGAIALFLLVATPTMHDVWAAPKTTSRPRRRSS